MKRIHITLILVLFIMVQTFAQEKNPTTYEVQYKVKYSIDSTNLDQKQDEIVYLYTGSKFGVFMNQNKAKAEDIEADIQKQMRSGGTIEINTKTSNFDKTFYKDLQTGKVETEAEIANKAFAFNEPKMPVKWTIVDSTKTVMDYPVQKATTSFAGRDYVAWFTLQVPIHDGPYLFSGLPGMIVELYDTRNDYHFTLQSLEKLDAPKIWTMPEVKEVTKAKFKKLKAKAAKNAPQGFNDILRQSLSGQNIDVDAASISVKVSKDGRELSKGEIHRMFRKMKAKNNNPIELK